MLFLAFDLTQDERPDAANRILVEPSQVEQLAARFERTWLRPPTEAELAVSATEIARTFGKTFAQEEVALAPGAWSGPLYSGLGAHLVLVTDRRAGNRTEPHALQPGVRDRHRHAACPTASSESPTVAISPLSGACLQA